MEPLYEQTGHDYRDRTLHILPKDITGILHAYNLNHTEFFNLVAARPLFALPNIYFKAIGSKNHSSWTLQRNFATAVSTEDEAIKAAQELPKEFQFVTLFVEHEVHAQSDASPLTEIPAVQAWAFSEAAVLASQGDNTAAPLDKPTLVLRLQELKRIVRIMLLALYLYCKCESLYP